MGQSPVFMRMLISASTKREPASWYAMRFGLPDTESVCIFHPLGSETPVNEMSLRLRCTPNTRGVGPGMPDRRRPWRVPCLILRRSTQQTFFHATHTTDCTGIFKVMAQQVRPGLTNPARFKGHRQSVDLIRRQPAYSIRARGQVPFNEAECMAAISTCKPEPKMMLGNKGASMYEPATPTSRTFGSHLKGASAQIASLSATVGASVSGSARTRPRLSCRLRAASRNSSRRFAQACIMRRRSGRCSA